MLTVRDGQKVWPYCEECGCRLQVSGNLAAHWYGNRIEIRPFVFEITSDARGCICSKVIDFWFLDIVDQKYNYGR